MVGIGLVVGLGLVQSLYGAHRAVVPAIAWHLVIIVVQQMRCSLKCTISERAEKDVCS